ncbi:MAG: aldo/keto reductase [Planctomycetota bacterium]
MSDLSSIALGLWPIAGITTVGVTRQDARSTLAAAIDAGIQVFDTAYSYGYDGESDRLLGEFLGTRRDEFCVLGKVGQRWTDTGERYVDGSPQQLTADTEHSLQRMRTEAFDVLFLHSPDPDRPIEESAAAMLELKQRGLCQRIGISNATPDQLHRFHRVATCDAIQCPLNLVQTHGSRELIASANSVDIKVYAFWTLMKGLLAGQIGRDHVFEQGDSRPNYPIFQGELRATIHDMIDQMRSLGEQRSRTVAQLAVGWVLSQPEVKAALVGARRPEQIRELAAATKLDAETLEELDRLAARVRKLKVES